MDRYTTDKSMYPLCDKETFADSRYGRLGLSSSRNPNFPFDSYRSQDELHGAWKMHIFASTEAERQAIMDTCGKYLSDNDIDWKVYSSKYDVSQLGGVQTGKIFTVFPRTKAEFAQVACDLDYIIRNNDLETTGSKISGDASLGTTGRLFYRYELNSKDCTDSKGNRALDSNFSLDLSKPNEDRIYRNDYYDANYKRQAYYNENGVPRGGARHLASDMTINDDPWYNFDPANPDNNGYIQRLEAESYYNQQYGNQRYGNNEQSYQKVQNLKVGEKLPNETDIEVNSGTVLALPCFKNSSGKTQCAYIDFSSDYWRDVVSRIPEGKEITVGREGADISFGSQYEFMSRKHLTITKKNGRIIVRDYSRNGTTVVR